MALGNWAFQMWDARGYRRPGRCFWISHAPSFCIAIYKNYIDIEDRLSWAGSERPRYISPIACRIEQGGQREWRGVVICTYRGPQNGLYAAVWTFEPKPRGAFFAGVERFDDRTGEDVGLRPSSIDWFQRKLSKDVRLPQTIFGYQAPRLAGGTDGGNR